MRCWANGPPGPLWLSRVDRTGYNALAVVPGPQSVKAVFATCQS
jgi:hypothetical protein